MNKKNKIGIIILLVIIIFVGAISIMNVNSEININNVAGVNNVKLNNTIFTASAIDGGVDAYHAPNGDMVIGYLPTQDSIRFSNITDIYNENTFFSESGYIFNDTYTTTTPITIAGIKGYYSHDVSMGDSFIFVMNNKVYVISIENGSLSTNLNGVEFLLTAWLKSSGLKQTWNYPENNNVNNKVETSNNSSNIENTGQEPSYDKYAVYLEDAKNDPRMEDGGSVLSRNEFYRSGQDKYY